MQKQTSDQDESDDRKGKMKKKVKIIILGCASLLGAIVIAMVIVSSIGPDIAVYTGHQMPKRFMETIRSLNLLEEYEQIRFFYSDAMIDIKNGLYFVTDKNLVLYSRGWEEPETIIPFDQIASLDVRYDDSLVEDTIVFVTTRSGMLIYFPVSSVRGLDKKFVEAIREKLNVVPNPPADADKRI
jgi:hypothetical protein